MFKIDKTQQLGKPLSHCVVDTLEELMAGDERIIALDADLGGASGFTAIAQSYPARFINAGIAEANMVGVASGLSMTGFIPFIHTFAPFATRRVFDQLFISGAYAKNTLNIYGSDPGFTVGLNGGTHTSWEDVALMRTIPEAVVCDAADAVQMKWLIEAFSQIPGIHYVRGNRKAVENVYAEGSSFTLGVGNVVREGSDLLLITSGQLLSEVLKLADSLIELGISSEVIDMFTIKPLDVDLIVSEIVGKRAVVTVENHSIIGGLGSAVAEVLAERGVNIPLTRIGARDVFGEVGTPDFLQKAFGLTAEQMKDEVKMRFS
ncbi:MAG: alpha-ketoacid dehydrogenase subunit beta [Streptococcaceae bacterium]|jgi:transketolase|nr:alpha-ketoacid dehydrogenase subunit beta [Streptococcaceae bacterium]